MAMQSIKEHTNTMLLKRTQLKMDRFLIMMCKMTASLRVGIISLLQKPLPRNLTVL